LRSKSRGFSTVIVTGFEQEASKRRVEKRIVL
jgi:hypothetical protein